MIRKYNEANGELYSIVIHGEGSRDRLRGSASCKSSCMTLDNLLNLSFTICRVEMMTVSTS